LATYVALLRGVNVGKAKRVPMAELRALLSDLGYTGVATLLNSGNAVFRATRGTPASHARNIATAITERLGIQVPVIVKPAKELSAIIADSPIRAEPLQHSRYLVAFAADAGILANLSVLEPLVAAPEQFAIGKRAAYLLCVNGILDSKAASALLGRAGQSVTTRNWATVLKLQALASLRV
jgi:uncharacterized protein (DUF1697 family)